MEPGQASKRRAAQARKEEETYAGDEEPGPPEQLRVSVRLDESDPPRPRTMAPAGLLAASAAAMIVA